MKLLTSLFFIIGIVVLTISLILVMGRGYGSHDVLPETPVGLLSTESSQSRLHNDIKSTPVPILVEKASEIKSLESFTAESNDLQGIQKSKFAYVTLIHGIDNTF